MNSFLAQIGSKLADRWVNALLLPGLLWTALLAAALHLGQGQPFAASRLGAWLDQLASRPAAHTPGTVAIAGGAFVLAAAAVGLLAGALGTVIERLWVMPADIPPAAFLLHRRQRRWDKATQRLKTAILHAAQPERHAIATDRAAAHARARQRRRARLGPARPVCPTRVADRFARTAARAAELNGLDDLALAWPRLWTVLPTELRADITTARSGYAAVARLAGWGLLYTILAAVWWPAALVGPAILATAALRAPSAANVLADLVEAGIDLYICDLAERLGVSDTAPSLDTGHAISERLRTVAGRPLQQRPPASRSTPELVEIDEKRTGGPGSGNHAD